ncbi:hypothetical protein [Streptomyces sp. NPDC059278]|uniref:hypothetical protein n=1 Tax=Streptomyces sp. NPDC059278 TaxID=3346801 RepID=UPI0036BB16A1
MNGRVRGADCEGLFSGHGAERMVESPLEGARPPERLGALPHRPRVGSHRIAARSFLVPQSEEVGGRAAVQQGEVV